MVVSPLRPSITALVAPLGAGLRSASRLVAVHLAIPLATLIATLIVTLIITLLATPLATPLAMAETRPNILLLFADDQRADTIGAWGNEFIHTPSLDSLAARGFSFRQAYCMGSPHGAVCQPSRAMLLSGRSLFHITLNLEKEPLLPELLRRSGYRTFLTGKWHNGEASCLRAFDHGKTVFLGGMTDHTKVPVTDIGPDGKLIRQRVENRFSAEAFADTAIDFLKEQGSRAPFFAYVAFTSPHDPRQPPLYYRELYYGKGPPLPPNFLPQHPFDNGWLTVRDEMLAPWPRPPDMVRDQLAEYYGMITHLDEQIGRILKALEESGLAERTIIVFASDHGLALGSHGLLGKQSLYEHSMRTPLIVAGPGIPRGGSSDALVYLHDLFPTLLMAAGAPTPGDIDGKALQPIWEGKAAGVRDAVFTALGATQRAVRSGRWKLIRYPQVDKTQLFDLEADPAEKKDLSADPDQKERLAELLGLLAREQAAAGDKEPLRVENPLPAPVDLTGHAREPDPWQPRWIRRKYFSQ